MASDPSVDVEDVPVYSDFAPVYGTGESLKNASARYERIFDEFKKLYGHEPSVFARAPGRVNLIGEHIDYEGYPVLPMAIKFDTVVAIRLVHTKKKKGILKVANLDSEKYPPVEYQADPYQEVDLKNLKWAHYFLCAFKGVFDHLAERRIKSSLAFSLEVLIHGVVPLGSGLSSSAALVCSSAIAIMASLGLIFPKNEVAEFCCKCERYIGTQSGGMDQAISLLAESGGAMLVEFEPIRAHPVQLPGGATLVVANSLSVSKKAETASTNYNLRVVECHLAAVVLAISVGEHSVDSALAQISTLSQLASIPSEPPQILSLLTEHLHSEPYTTAELESILGLPLAELFKYSKSSLAVLERASEFKLFQRARHVYLEALRVQQFREVASKGHSGEIPPQDALIQMGNLMNESHESCSVFYECSCPELEELVSAARSNGALGSRLTGAGWGGCTVSLVNDDHVEDFILALKAEFYQKRVESGIVKEEDLDISIFATKPSAGAALFRM